MSENPSAPRLYLAGLDLAGRRVLVAGAGRVATRRVPRLLEAGALVEVVAPRASDEIRSLAAAGRLTWHAREVAEEDIEGAWYVLAATDSAAANRMLAERCLANRIFCVRSDAAAAGTAWTASVATVGSHLVAVLGNRDPRGTTGLLARIVAALAPPLKDAP